MLWGKEIVYIFEELFLHLSLDNFQIDLFDPFMEH